jgi:hypothetical protein
MIEYSAIHEHYFIMVPTIPSEVEICAKMNEMNEKLKR